MSNTSRFRQALFNLVDSNRFESCVKVNQLMNNKTGFKKTFHVCYMNKKLRRPFVNSYMMQKNEGATTPLKT